MKRFLTLLCTLALVLCMFPATVFAAGEGNMYSGGSGMGRVLPPTNGPQETMVYASR